MVLGIMAGMMINLMAILLLITSLMEDMVVDKIPSTEELDTLYEDIQIESPSEEALPQYLTFQEPPEFVACRNTTWPTSSIYHDLIMGYRDPPP
ncbi:hypothetical protein L1987_05614 [Smallanthus sonchifolius]|uniref:Uncharacterized protein n=1 Tax=Smallanthus sonchifolius TaxID=185202 RepID=A0ACB9JW10_9ASTR|nr:hypothetical protein L1987_05614 [Smallanthus sonchifolius]